MKMCDVSDKIKSDKIKLTIEKNISLLEYSNIVNLHGKFSIKGTNLLIHLSCK